MAESTQQVRRFFTPPFVLAVAMLSVAAFLTGPVADLLGFIPFKSELPIRKPLNKLSEASLGGYQIKKRFTLEDVIIEALGTEEYISWRLEAPARASDDPLKVAHLDVTYYTGGQNLVPHTPDVCMVGGGYQGVKFENKQIGIKALDRQFPIRVCTFRKLELGAPGDINVVYTFYCNGDFRVNPRLVRARLNEPRNRYAYFSKVEISFPFWGATREQTVEGAKILMEGLLPELIDAHWPDFEAAERQALDEQKQAAGGSESKEPR